MKKILTGMELMQLIKDGKVKEDTRFILDDNYLNAIYKKNECGDLSLMWEDEEGYLSTERILSNNFTPIIKDIMKNVEEIKEYLFNNCDNEDMEEIITYLKNFLDTVYTIQDTSRKLIEEEK